MKVSYVVRHVDLQAFTHGQVELLAEQMKAMWVEDNLTQRTTECLKGTFVHIYREILSRYKNTDINCVECGCPCRFVCSPSLRVCKNNDGDSRFLVLVGHVEGSCLDCALQRILQQEE